MSFGSSTVPIRVCVRATKLYLLITAPLSLLIAFTASHPSFPAAAPPFLPPLAN